jgi:hypothetical protein
MFVRESWHLPAALRSIRGCVHKNYCGAGLLLDVIADAGADYYTCRF